MLQANPERNRDRAKSAVGVAAFHGLLGYAFLTGLGFDLPAEVGRELKMFDVFEKEPPPPATPAPPEEVPEEVEIEKPKEAEGAASPANLRDTPTEIVVPPPKIRIEVPPPLPAARVAGQGNAPAAGAADVPGPGTGSGGEGNGLGSGSQGNGTGGGGGGRFTPARWVRGSIRDSDYPISALRARIGGTVHLRFIVAPNGRVSQCTVTRSSGNADLDSTTCRLIQRRFRYEPARDASGRPVPFTIVGDHGWEIGRRPGPPIVEEEYVEE